MTPNPHPAVSGNGYVIERLRKLAGELHGQEVPEKYIEPMYDAADEIERLRGLLKLSEGSDLATHEGDCVTLHEHLLARTKERDALREALKDMLRILLAVKLSAGLGSGQIARIKKAEEILSNVERT